MQCELHSWFDGLRFVVGELLLCLLAVKAADVRFDLCFLATGTLKPPKTIVSDDGVGLERCWAQSTYNAADSLFVLKVGMGFCDLLLGWCIARL